jgi:hypothetical protein
MFERFMTFADYVRHYGLDRSEGLLLRHLTDAYKGIVQTVPEDAKTDAVYDLTEWLRETVRQTDSSLLDEWERLRDGVQPEDVVAATEHELPAEPPRVTANARAFRVMVRNDAFRRVELLARRRYDELDDDLVAAMERYWAAHDSIGIGADARSSALFQVEESADVWRVRQVLDDPAGDHDWALHLEVDLAASDAAGVPVTRVIAIGD